MATLRRGTREAAGGAARTSSRTWAALLLAALGGWLWALQFESRPLVVAPWIALAPLLLLLGERRSGRLGWLHGAVSWFAALPWIAPTLERFGDLPGPLTWALLVLLALYLGGFTGVFAAVGSRAWRGSATLALVVVPSAWVVLEVIRGWLISGFPWNLAAYAWVEVPGALPLAAWIGPWGLSWLVLWSNTGAALAVARRRWEPAAVGALLPLVLLAVAGRWAGPDEAGPPVPSQPVRVLQPNIPIFEDGDWERAAAAYRDLMAMTTEACDTPGTLVVWPESAAFPFNYFRDDALRQDLAEIVRRGCPVLLNSAYEGVEGTFNSALLLTPEAGLSRQDKRHLVPFGEFVPLAGVLPFVGTLARNAGAFTPGASIELLDWGEERLGLAICFEITFPGEVAQTVREGATTLVTITNDAWYGDSAAPWQHYRAARFRAAENGRPLLRAALTGISAIVDVRGRELALLPPFAEGVLHGSVRGRRELTLYTRLPWAVPAACGAVLAVAALGLVRRRRNGAARGGVLRAAAGRARSLW